MTLPSAFDEKYFPASREFINKKRLEFLSEFINKQDVICDVGNQGKHIPELNGYNLVTLDISDSSKPDFVADITMHNHAIENDYFDVLMCTEVLEHVVDPFSAVQEMERIIKQGGYILVTTPLNARIHGPVPDCWRFTEFGLKVLFRNFDIVKFDRLDTPDRNLFPLHYAMVVRKKIGFRKDIDPRTMKFTKVD